MSQQDRSEWKYSLEDLEGAENPPEAELTWKTKAYASVIVLLVAVHDVFYIQTAAEQALGVAPRGLIEAIAALPPSEWGWLGVFHLVYALWAYFMVSRYTDNPAFQQPNRD